MAGEMYALKLDGEVYPIRHQYGPLDRETILIRRYDAVILGSLSWHRYTHEITYVKVLCTNEILHNNAQPHECYRRRGIANALLQIAREDYEPGIRHSATREDDGEAWVQSLHEDNVPERKLHEVPGAAMKLLQPLEGIDGTDRSDTDLLSLEDEAMPRRELMVKMADALVKATLVGNPAPTVLQMYMRMKHPQPGDLVVEQTARRDPERAYHGFGILLAHRVEWASTDEDWEVYLSREREASSDGWIDDERLKTDAWYIQYGPHHRDICRWEDADFIAIPVEQ